MNKVKWNPVETKHFIPKEHTSELMEVKIGNPNKWGYIILPNNKYLTVGYEDAGLTPFAVVKENRIFIGINELIGCYSTNSKIVFFETKSPSIFHEFICLNPIIIRDEIGFVSLSSNGSEIWSHLVDSPIDKYTIKDGIIEGTTIDGEIFKFNY